MNGSISATPQIEETKNNLEKIGHEVEIPWMSQRIINKEIPIEDFLKEKKSRGDEMFRKQSEEDLIKRYYEKIKESGIVLVINVDKDGVKNYIGGNVLIEMGFAYILDKKIYLLNDIPKINYCDEIKAMKPIILNGDINKIK